MATQDPLDQLQRLLTEKERQRGVWAPQLETLRAQASATTAVLSELAQTAVRPQRPEVEILLAGPDQNWAEEVMHRLRMALPAATVNRHEARTPLREAPSSGCTVRCSVALSGIPHAEAVQKVRAELASIPDLEVDYSEPIDLIVVTPRG